VQLRLRVSLPDRPGALGRVTSALGSVGADVVLVTVLARESGRAWDDLTVAWPDGADRVRLAAALSTLPGVVVDGIWPTRDVPGSFPDLDVLEHVAAAPGRAVETLVDALPGILSASWAAALSTAADEEVVHASAGAPGAVRSPRSPSRPQSFSDEGRHFAAVPLPTQAVCIVAAREEGAAFHEVELLRLRRLGEIVEAVARQA
jgi:hypothetical protein